MKPDRLTIAAQLLAGALANGSQCSPEDALFLADKLIAAHRVSLTRDDDSLKQRLQQMTALLAEERKSSNRWHAEAREYSEHVQKLDAALSRNAETIREMSRKLNDAENAKRLLAECVRDDIVTEQERLFCKRHGEPES